MRGKGMLFTAPAFAFVFLPLSILFMVLFGKNRKRSCLLIVCIIYQVLLHASAPVGLLWLPLLIVYTYAAERITKKVNKKWLTFALCAAPVAVTVTARSLLYLGIMGGEYPLGITVPVLASVSYICDRSEKGEGLSDLLGLALYLSFFPLMILGPFIRYNEFCHLTEGDSMSITLSGVSEGIGLYATGFIKRIAVGAVLVDGYQKIFAASWDTPSLVIILLLLIIIYFGVFFSVSGYYDMGVGIARMLGVSVPRVEANPFAIATVNEYSKGLFGSVREWAKHYVVSPLCRILEKKELSGFSKTAIYCLCTFLVVRADPFMIVLTVPLVAFAMASATLKLDKAYRPKHSGLRGVFGLLTVLVVGAFWVFVTMGVGNDSVLDYIGDITAGNAEYQTDMVLISFSGIKYLFVSLVGFCTVLPRMRFTVKLMERLSPKWRSAVDYGSMVVMLALFAFTLVFFLPQFEMYAEDPFAYIII